MNCRVIRLIFVMICGGCLPAVVGCVADEPPLPEGGIRLVDPGVPGSVPGGSGGGGGSGGDGGGPVDITLADSEPVRWVSRRLSLPLSRSLDTAWAVTDESVLPDLSRAVWNGNGLRVGVLSNGQGGAFMSGVGEVDKTRDTQVLSYDFLEELRASPPLRAEFYADLTLPSLPVLHETLTGGQLRMLMASRPLGNGSTRVTLTPQHYRPKITLLPRSPQQRILDGRVYDELSIRIDIRDDQVLVLGFYDIAQPPPPAPPPGAEPPAQENQTGQDGGEEVPARDAENESTNKSAPPTTDPMSPPAEDGEPPIAETEAEEIELPPLTLGRGLLTTGVKKDDQQLLFLLRPIR